jgi:hypothetical protein
MCKKVLLFALLSVIILSSHALAGPFGLSMGMSLEEFGPNPVNVGHGKFRVENVPKPHSEFVYYIVQVGPTKGLCWIKAIGKDIETSAYGIELKNAFNSMKERLKSNYGESKTMDLLLPGSIWNEPSDWMMSLIKKERILVSIWNKDGESDLSEDLKQIGLITSSISQNKGYISIEYSFVNEDDCEDELREQQDSVL